MWQRNYERDLTLVLEIEDIENLNALMLIKTIEVIVGTGKLYVLRPLANKQ